jgi:hypothetical protein
MNFIMSRKDERNPARLGASAQLVELFPVSTNLICVSPSKFLPAGRIVSEPIAQHGTWRDVLIPRIDTRVRFAHAARP